MQKLIPAMLLVLLAGFGQNALSANDGKVLVCHKGQTVYINTSGLSGHLNHGDTEGSCENRQAVVVMLQCAATDGGGIEVVAVSSSVDDPETSSIPIPMLEADCATSLADLLDARMQIDAVTPGSDGVTNYLLTGYMAVPAS